MPGPPKGENALNKNIRSFIKPGIVHFMAYPETQNGTGPVADQVLKLAEDDFFDVIEVARINDREERRKVRDVISTADLELCYAAMPTQKITGFDINDLDEGSRKKAVSVICEEVDYAMEMGAVKFAFKSGAYRSDSVEESLDALIRSTREICDYVVRNSDMLVTIEVFDYDVDTHSLIGPVELAKRYSDIICSEYSRFGLMVDLSHLPQLRETPAQSLLPVKNNINHAHFGNCFLKDKQSPVYGDKHPRFGYPGSENGLPQAVEYLRVLLEAGYLKEGSPNNLSMEVKPQPGENLDLIIAGAKRMLLKAWALV